MSTDIIHEGHINIINKGLIYLHLAEQYAAKMGKEYFRLDCAVDNAFLNRYYDAQGYVVVGNCVHGLYKGLLREKKM